MKLDLPSSAAFDVPEDGEPEVLRPLDWSALVARLGAERDLRRELASAARRKSWPVRRTMHRVLTLRL
jgi:hypothetical protein